MIADLIVRFNSPNHALSYLRARGLFVKIWITGIREKHIRFSTPKTSLDLNAINFLTDYYIVHCFAGNAGTNPDKEYQLSIGNKFSGYRDNVDGHLALLDILNGSYMYISII